MAVTAQIPRNVSIAAPGATVFPYDFKINDAPDLLLQVDGATAVLGVDYTLTGVGEDTGGGITFLSPLSGGETVMRRRAMAFARDTDFQNLGDLRSGTLNNDQDAPIMMVQQVAEEVSRAFKVDDGSGLDLRIPAPDPGHLLGWNDAGNALQNTPAPDVATGIYVPGYPGAKASRLVTSRLRESRILLTDFAAGDGVTLDTQAVKDWLTALSTERRAGYAPAGEYLIAGIQLLGLDDLHIEAHPEARFIGSRSYQNFSGNGLAGQQFTVTDFTKSYGTIRAAQITSGGIHIPLDVGVHFSVSGYTITLLGATTIPVGDTLRAVSSESILEVRSLGTSTARSGRFTWEGGYWDVSQRGVVNSQASGSGLTIHYFNKYDIHGATFFGAEDYMAGDVAGVADSGVTALYCDNGSVTGNVFQGFGDLGIYATGGELSTNVDDGIGLVVQGNHFVKNTMGWKAARQLKNVVASGNTYDRCWIGAALWPASNIKAGRGSITGETFYRCGRNAIDVRQQVGCVIADNRIIDHGYLLDGTTTADLYGNGGSVVAIGVSGCRATQVANNVIVMELLPKQADAYGIRNLSLLFEGVTDQPTDNMVINNLIDGYNTGIQENGSGTGNRYRGNEFRNCTTDYSGVPNASLPFGTYTPALTNTANIAASVAYVLRWRRVEKDIHVDVVVDIDPTATGTAELRFDLPVDPGANFTTDAQVSGLVFNESANVAGRVSSLVGSKLARVRITYTGDIGSRQWVGSCSYRVA